MQCETFRRVARTHPEWVQVLEVVQRNAQLFGVDLRFGRQQVRELFQAERQVTVVIQGLDEQLHQVVVPLRKGHGTELPVEVLAQRGCRCLDIAIIGLVVVTARGARCAFTEPIGLLACRRLGRRRVSVRLGRLRLFTATRQRIIAGAEIAGLGVQVLPFQQRIVLQKLLDFLIQFERR